MDVAYERAAGDYLFQRHGATLEPVLDLIGGFGTTLLGHNHPELIEEARRLLADGVPFSAQASSQASAARLEDLLQSKVGDYRLVLTNSGTETVEAALKHAYLERPRRALWAVHNAFHGTTLAAIQLTEVH